MKTSAQKAALTLTAENLVTLALCRRALSDGVALLAEPHCPTYLAEKLLPAGTPVSFSHTFERSGCEVMLTASASRRDGGDLHFLFPVLPTDLQSKVTDTGTVLVPAPAVRRRTRGVAYIAAHLAALTGEAPIALHLHYIDPAEERHASLCETPDEKTLAAFFERVCRALDLYALPAAERAAERLPSMAALRFPFPQKRMGQGDLMQSVYRTLRRGGRLYASAPTGIGKTMSVLYPAVRALGEGHLEKIFYLTPKNTVARAAADAVRTLAAQGARIRAVRLFAKETLCANGLACRSANEDCTNKKHSQTPYERAVRMLYATNDPVIEAAAIKRAAAVHHVCPHELALAYSEVCDVIICDYNYLFNPDIALKRYFTEGGDYAFLIDEAHNLIDRGREMYSAALCSEQLAALFAWADEVSPPFALHVKEAATLFDRTLHMLLEDCTFQDEGVFCAYDRRHELPNDIFRALERLLADASDLEQKSGLPKPERRRLHMLLAPLRDLAAKADAYDDDCTSLLSRVDDNYSLRLFCINPAARLLSAMERGRGTVLFSATMEPLHYYKSVLGGDSQSEELSLPSPFPEEHVGIAVLDGISIRYADRDQTRPDIARAVAVTVLAKRGNYLVFCPSFDYLEELSDEFAAMQPNVKILRQTRGMTREARAAFLAEFTPNAPTPIVGFAVMGGVFSESVDLTGERLVGSIIVGVGLPSPTPECEACAAYYDERCDGGREYAYLYPGMNRVLQAAGRVIRTEHDRGVLVLIDDRFRDPFFRAMIPPHLRHLRFAGTTEALAEHLRRFWSKDTAPDTF